MTLEEAIQYYIEIAEEENQKIKRWNGDYPHLKKIDSCEKYAAEHRQIADWLKLLKRILDSGDCNVCAIRKHCNVVPELGEQVRYNCPIFVKKESE